MILFCECCDKTQQFERTFNETRKRWTCVMCGNARL